MERYVEIETLVEMTDEQIENLPDAERERILAQIEELQAEEDAAYDQWGSAGF